MKDCTVIYFDGSFKKRLAEQDKLKKEMIKRFGNNRPNDWRFTIKFDDNCVWAEHVSERELINR